MAILNVKGEVVKIKAGKDFSLKKILEFLSVECTPLVIASDVSPASGLVQKAATAFSVHVFAPQESLSRRGKNQLLKESGLSERGSHKRDALAAALNAYDSMLPMLKKIERRLYKRGLLNMVEIGDVARRILSGECSNIDKAIKKLTHEQVKGQLVARRMHRLANPQALLLVKEKEINSLMMMLDQAEEKNRALLKEIDILHSKVSADKDEMRTGILIGKDREVAALRSALDGSRKETERCRNEAGQLRRLVSLVLDGWLPVIFLESCEKSLAEVADKKYRLADKWICIKSDEKTSGLSLVKGSAGVFCRGRLIDVMQKEGMTALDLDKFQYQYSGNFGAVKIEKEWNEKTKTQQFVSWLERYKKGQFR